MFEQILSPLPLPLLLHEALASWPGIVITLPPLDDIQSNLPTKACALITSNDRGGRLDVAFLPSVSIQLMDGSDNYSHIFGQDPRQHYHSSTKPLFRAVRIVKTWLARKDIASRASIQFWIDYLTMRKDGIAV